jgi:hypothetical protein
MVEVTQFKFEWQEIAELLIKKAHIHEGRWVVVPEYTFNAGIIGPAPTESKPGVALLLNSLQLVKADANAPSQLVVDAAQRNPKS